MKKILKLFTALVLTVVLLFSLCSCIDIKKLRRSQGYYLDENKNSILFNGKTYDRIENWNDDIEVFLPKYGSVSEKEKPLLIANLTGDTLHYNEAEIIIQANYSNYCLREEYENMQLKMKNINFENYCIMNWRGDGLFEATKEALIVIDDEYVEAINYVIENVTPNYQDDIYFEESTEVYACDDSKTFRKYLCRIGRYESKYYLEYYNEETDEFGCYDIDSSRKEILKKLIGEEIDERLIVKG